METAAAGEHPAEASSLSKALAAPPAQESPSCPPASAGGSKAEARVLVINTGGTIGMVQDVKGEGAPGGGGSGAAEAGSPLRVRCQTGLVWGAGRAQDAPLGEGRLRLPPP